ncbi:MAG: DsbA family oxidoreductase [Leptospiraceae bacterium]|nr:DsbA family oxidoreductase [Leptospiraceae bacterium]MBP9164265.1 DsbA family oxidoreductase [Leptospiraceae bacterium]
MQVEIWSDIMCPFCYIGKRKFEAALEKFPNKDKVEIIWRSYQLDPNIKAQPDKDIYTYLAEAKGQSLEWSKKMHENVINMAKSVGLEYNFDKAVIANSFDAHRLIQLAKKHGLGDAMEERLFKAYFTEGKNFADHDTLATIGDEIGLDKNEILSMLQSDDLADNVHSDVEQGMRLGLRGVPFFVFNRQIGVAGAQDPEIFLQALQEANK